MCCALSIMFSAKGTSSIVDTVSNVGTRHNSILWSSSEAERGLSEMVPALKDRESTPQTKEATNPQIQMSKIALTLHFNINLGSKFSLNPP